MTTFLEEPAVSVVEVARRAGRTVEEVKTEAAALGFFVGLDWKHEEALTTKDAYALVDGSARRNLEHETAWRSHAEALEQWQKGREAARRRAFDEAWKRGVRAGRSNGSAMDVGHSAARGAVADFERANPEPVFTEPERRIAGWFRKVKAGAR